MNNPQVHNWFGDITSSPAIVVEPENVQDIISILQDTEKYPSPVRAVGSNHSTTQCGVADNGTLIVMRKMNRILNIGTDTVTVEAGALYIDVTNELRKHNLQFFVSEEIGSLTMGSAACAGTKSASMVGEFGQVSSYASKIKMITPSGDLIEITEEEPDLLHATRSSYGLFGIIYEVTFRVMPLQSMAVYHKIYSLDAFDKQLPMLKTQGESMRLFINPFINMLLVEFRRYRPDENPQKASSWQWMLRNFAWKTLVPSFSYVVTTYIPIKSVRYFLINRFSQLVGIFTVLLVRGKNTLSPDETIRYPKKATNSKFTFSFWAFPEEEYTRTLRAYFKFCREYYRSRGYRFNMFNVGYRVNKDTSALLSYSSDGTVMTIDPVSTGDPGWEEFLVAYNEFCSQRGGIPLFNQTKSITCSQVEKAFGERLATFVVYRKRFDPTERLLNDFFGQLLK